MASDTPRTDAVRPKDRHDGINRWEAPYFDLCCALERENAELRRAVRAAVDEAVTMYQQRSIDVSIVDSEEEQGYAGASEAAARAVRTAVLMAISSPAGGDSNGS